MNELEDELGEILKPLGDGGHHNNSDDKTRSTCHDCKRIDQARTKLTKLISKREIEANTKEIESAIAFIEMIGDETDQVVIKPYFLGRLTRLKEKK